MKDSMVYMFVASWTDPLGRSNSGSIEYMAMLAW